MVRLSLASFFRFARLCFLFCFATAAFSSGGFLTVDEDGYLNLTNAGREVAEKIYERHQFFTEQLVAVGVDRETAERDACRIEHVISEEAFEKLKTSVEKKY